MSSENKTKKRGKSLVLRFTANQVIRSFWLFLMVDVFILVITLGVMAVGLSDKATKTLELIGTDTQGLTEGRYDDVLRLMDCDYQLMDEPPVDSYLWDAVAKAARIPSGSALALAVSDAWGGRWYNREVRVLLTVPTEQADSYLRVRFDITRQMTWVGRGFFFLLCAEGIALFFGIFEARQDARRILAPINELTMTAWNMNTQLTTQPKLKLSGAINTLNTITEERLDTRISIDDERDELKGLAAAINGMLDRLDAAYHAQLRFVSDASHELRTPIAVIQGYANLLDRWGKRDEKTLQESIDAIKSEASGMEDLVEQLLFLARTDNNSIKLDAEIVDLSALAEEVLRETKMIHQNHEFAGNIQPGLTVYGDGKLIKQAVRIFVDNAIKYTPTGGHITLGAKENGGDASIWVSDTGIGIPDKDIAHVFDRFFRTDESRARQTGGTGLGLAIAKWIVDRHGGFLELFSRQDVGTKISASFPIPVLSSTAAQ